MTKKTRILYLGNKLSAHGFTPTAIELLGPALQQEGYTILYASDKTSKIFRLLDMLAAILKYQKQVDVVLIDTYSTSAFYFAWVAAVVCRQLNIPYIPILHGGNLPARLQRSPRKCTQLFDKSYTNVAVSAYLEHELKQRSFKSLLIPNAIDISAYPFKLRSSLQPSLLWVRSFHRIYNPEMAIRVLKQLKQKYPAARLTMVGPDKDGSLAACKLLCEELGIAQSVTFTGKLSRTEWVRLSAGHDIFINTSTVDNLPFSIIEAMALGLPIVSTNVGGIPFLMNESTGMLVNSNDVQSMANAVEHLITSGGENYSRSARALAKQYDWSVVKHKWINLLDNV